MRLSQKEKGKSDMARPQAPFTAKPTKQRNTGSDKMRMSYERMRRDIKRIETEQAKAADMATPKRGRK
jgi:hypothetical protein